MPGGRERILAMISELRGRVSRKSRGLIVLDVSGVGFEVFVNSKVSEGLSEGQECHLYTRLLVREDSWSLYGFRTPEERACFDLLMTVKGVGPKMSMAVLERLSPQQFYRAIVSGNEDALRELPGVGRKTAARLVLELRDRIGLGEKKSNERPVPAENPVDEACNALVALGYSWEEAASAVEQALHSAKDADFETLLREALKRLARI